MEPEHNIQENRRESRAFIKSPLRLAVFSIAILMLAAFAMRLIGEGSPVVSAGAF
jgi:hypothetical protein